MNNKKYLSKKLKLKSSNRLRYMLLKSKWVIFMITLFISCVVFSRWLNFSIHSSGDYYYTYAQSLKDISVPSVWTSLTTTGNFDTVLWRLPFRLLYSIFNNNDYGSEFLDKIFIFFPIIIATPLISFILIEKLLKSKIAAIYGSFVFTYNTYILSIITQGHLLLVLPVGFMFLAVFLYIKSHCSIRLFFSNIYILLTSLTLFVIGSLDFRMYYVSMIVILVYFLFEFQLSIRLKRNNYIFQLANLIFLLFLTLLLNLYWLLPTTLSGSLLNNTVLTRDLFGSHFFNITRASALFHPFWGVDKVDWFTIQKIPWYFFFYPIFAILGAFVNRNNKHIQFFSILGLIGIFLSKQVSPPFGYVYEYLFNNLPGFSAFREASKFYIIIAISYSVLIGSFVSWVWNIRTTNFYLNFCKSLFISIVGVILIWNTRPLITGKIGTIFLSKQIPNDYRIIATKISNDSEYFRTFWTPGISRWNYYSSKNPEISNVNFISDNWANSTSILSNNISPINEQITRIFHLDSSNSIFDQYSIKYIIIPQRDKNEEDDIFVYYGGNRDYYINILNKISWLKKVNLGTKELVIYENIDYRPHIYQSYYEKDSNNKFKQDRIDIQFENPSKYTLTLNTDSRPFNLIFSEAYHPDWKIRVGSFNWLNVIVEKDYFLSDNNHKINDVKLNSFYIDPVAICKKFKCEYNSENKYQINLTLYFKSQSYLYFGIIISLITLITIIIVTLKIMFNFSKLKN